jgi:hypothetical protein
MIIVLKNNDYTSWLCTSRLHLCTFYTGEDLKWDTPQGCHFKSLPIPRHLKN